MENGVPRILLIRLSAIGDVVRVLPALHALRNRYPHAQIDWVVEAKSAAILENHPALDNCLVFERPAGFGRAFRAFRNLCRQLRARRYDMAVDFHGIFKSGLLTRATRAPKRYGFARPRSREFSPLFTNNKVSLPKEPMNRIEENLELAAALGVEKHHLDVQIGVPETVQDEVDRYFDEAFHGGKRVAVVHAPVDRPEKQWPLDHYAQLCDRLLGDGRFEVILTWGPGQRGAAQQVADGCLRSPGIAPETPDLMHFARLVQRAHVFFGGDTGPMHIASAMGTPVAAVFGGTDPRRHAPLREPSLVLYAGPPDVPRRLPLATAQEHLAQIDPDAAYDACVELAFPPWHQD